jgi:hypothetical protein
MGLSFHREDGDINRAVRAQLLGNDPANGPKCDTQPNPWIILKTQEFFGPIPLPLVRLAEPET